MDPWAYPHIPEVPTTGAATAPDLKAHMWNFLLLYIALVIYHCLIFAHLLLRVTVQEAFAEGI